MGCLIVIVLGAVSAGMIYFFGYPEWVLIFLGLLWFASLVATVFLGHRGFGGGGNTDLQIVIACLFAAIAIVLPNYNSHQPCSQAKTALRTLSDSEFKYFDEHKSFAANLASLSLSLNQDIQLSIIKADGQSFIASASHSLCKNDKDGTQKVFIWDSDKGGLQY